MKNELLLLSGNDIPFIEAQLIIHQPTLKEIAYIGEETFYTGCEFLRFSKDNLDLEEKDKNHLEQYTNFEVLMSMIKERNEVILKNKVCLLSVLALIFPTYQINLKQNYISFINPEIPNEEFQINNNNFLIFKDIMESMFCLEKTDEDKMNPSGEIAKRIADKLKKRHQKLQQKESGPHKVSVLSRYVSILSAGQTIDINTLMNYTVFQIFDAFKRYELKTSYDANIAARLAGATELQDPEDWMQDIHLEIE